MNPSQLAVPDDLTDWLAQGDRAAELLSDSVLVDQQWWIDTLAEFDMPNTLHGNRIGREELFTLGAVAGESPEDAIALLWNVVAFCLGRQNADGKKRIAAVAADRKRLGKLPQEAAIASRDDPGAAYAMLRPDKGGNTIDRLGPGGFTWYLYFAGAGDPKHPSPVLEAKVGRSLRRAGWKGLRDGVWTAADYVAYSRVVDSWRTETGVDRNDVIVRGPLSTDDLRVVHRWLCTLSALAPRSAEAQVEFRQLGHKISQALNGEVSEIYDGFDEDRVYGSYIGRRI